MSRTQPIGAARPTPGSGVAPAPEADEVAAPTANVAADPSPPPRNDTQPATLATRQGAGTGAALREPATVSATAATAVERRKPTAHFVGIGNPMGDVDVHASVYAFAPAVLGWALEQLARRYPAIDQHLATRFVELALVVGAEVPWMVYSHEGGHYRVARRHGWEASIDLNGWASGLTHYRFPNGKLPTNGEDLEASAAGVNQEQLNALTMFRDWALAGGTRYQEALGFLLAQTNLALYAARTYSLGKNTASSDDIASYVSRLRADGHNVEVPHLLAMAAAADLLSPSFWAALIGGARFLFSGQRQVSVPTVRLGRVELALPHLYMLLTKKGPALGLSTFVNPHGRVPVELGATARTDGSGAAVSARLHHVPLFGPLSVNPFLRLSYQSHQGAGVAVGADLDVEINRHVGLRLGGSYRRNDLLRDVEGKKDGVEAHGAVRLSF